MSASRPRLGVVIVAFESAEIIDECLESLFASHGPTLRVVVVDNASTDATCAVVRDWASGGTPFQPRPNSPLAPAAVVAKPVALAEAAADAPLPAVAQLTLLRSAINGGYAYAVNLGLRQLATDPDIDLFWVLNPDCVVPPDTAAAIVAAAGDGGFSLIGGRTLHYDRPDTIQTDGGQVSRQTGRCRSLNAGRSRTLTPMPDAATLDYITGAHLIASRAFIAQAGPMAEDYFLYYEEVDWAFRRGALPLRVAPAAIVYHHGGTTIGSGSTVRRASPFANYFNYRNRQRFVWRFMPMGAVGAIGYAFAKTAQLALIGARDEAAAVIAGALHLPPPAAVRARIKGDAARRLAFGG